jgi:hypothetical protein
MRNLILTMGFSLVLFLLAGLRAADAETVAAGGLALTVDEAGRVVRLEVGAKDVTAAAAPAPLVELADVARGPDFVPGRRTAGDLVTSQ